MNEKVICIWFVAGLVPHHIEKQQIRNRQTLEVRAPFWSFRYARDQWTVHVTLIERLRNLIWTAVTHRQGNEVSQE